MPLDPDAQGVLDLLASLNAPEFSELTPEEARGLSLTPPPAVPTAVGSVVNRTIPGEGGDIGLRIYTPETPEAPDGDAPTGALVYFHGGGWVIGDLDSHDETCRKLCSNGGQTIVSVDYRLAPETRFPGAIDDCYSATQWVADNAAALNIDAARLAVGGDSAGGNLAAACALMARDKGGPAIAFQLLIYPVTGRDFNTASYIENAEGYLLSKKAMQWFWDHYVPDTQERSNPYAAPLEGELSGLPPALVMTAEYDPLRDEGEAYAQALQDAGCAVQMIRYDGLIHGFFGMFDAIAAAQDAMQQATDALIEHIG